MTNGNTDIQTAGMAVMRATGIGIGAAYAVLIGLLAALHPDWTALLAHNVPYVVVTGLALLLIIGPLAFPRLQAKRPITGHGLGRACARQALPPQRVAGFAALGFVLGAMLHQLVKLAFG
ncbi:MAG: hypothetical protein WBG08_03265 [Litorimonas sp.]